MSTQERDLTVGMWEGFVRDGRGGSEMGAGRETNLILQAVGKRGQTWRGVVYEV